MGWLLLVFGVIVLVMMIPANGRSGRCRRPNRTTTYSTSSSHSSTYRSNHRGRGKSHRGCRTPRRAIPGPNWRTSVETDGDGCWLCSQPVEHRKCCRTLDMFATGDLYPASCHVISKARGGSDSPSKIKLAHLACAGQRGADNSVPPRTPPPATYRQAQVLLQCTQSGCKAGLPRKADSLHRRPHPLLRLTPAGIGPDGGSASSAFTYRVGFVRLGCASD